MVKQRVGVQGVVKVKLQCSGRSRKTLKSVLKMEKFAPPEKHLKQEGGSPTIHFYDV